MSSRTRLEQIAPELKRENIIRPGMTNRADLELFHAPRFGSPGVSYRRVRPSYLSITQNITRI